MKIYGAVLQYSSDQRESNAAIDKEYLDKTIATLPIKVPCKVATTTNITLSGVQTIDGVSVSVNDRVLVKNQTNATQNGIYDVKSDSWVRSIDVDNGGTEVIPGMTCYVERGTTNGGGTFILNTPGPITLGTTSLAFSTIASAGDASAILDPSGDVLVDKLPEFLQNINYQKTAVTGNYTMVATDNYLGCRHSSAININLIKPAIDGYIVIIKDETGVANRYSITITPNGLDTIESNNSVIIKRKYTSLTLMYMQGNWSII